MSIKLIILKSGENIISDIKEIISENNIVGYLLNKPHLLNARTLSISEEKSSESIENDIQVFLEPWILFSKDEQIPIRPDWVVTVVDPILELVKIYEEKVNGKFKIDTADEQSDSTNTNIGGNI